MKPGQFSYLSKDVGPSLVVFLIALPLSMGIAHASGVPAALGLVTAIIGGVVVGLLGGAPLQISGPSAGLAVLIMEMVHRFRTDDDPYGTRDHQRHRDHRRPLVRQSPAWPSSVGFSAQYRLR